MGKLLVTPEAAGEMLSIKRTKVFALLKSGELRSVRVGRLRRISTAAIVEYVERREDLDVRQGGQS